MTRKELSRKVQRVLRPTKLILDVAGKIPPMQFYDVLMLTIWTTFNVSFPYLTCLRPELAQSCNVHVVNLVFCVMMDENALASTMMGGLESLFRGIVLCWLASCFLSRGRRARMVAEKVLVGPPITTKIRVHSKQLLPCARRPSSNDDVLLPWRFRNMRRFLSM